MYDFKIVKKPQFTLTGYVRKFNSATSYEEIPKFWDEHFINNGEKIAEGDDICGEYGVCYGCGDNGEFSYMIADDYVPVSEIPNGAEIKVVPAHTWAVFECNGALPKALQDVNTYIFNDWLPNSRKYRMVGDLNIEVYFDEDDYSEIWIPVEEI